MNKHFFLIALAILPFFSLCQTKTTNHHSSTSFANSKKPSGKTFAVADVVLPDSLLRNDVAGNVFENKLEKDVLFYPEEFKNDSLVNTWNNAFLQAIQDCYDQHRPLILTPDVIWLAICQGVSIHINQKYDSLKDLIFIKNKPSTLLIRNDSLEYSGKHWRELMSSFSDTTRKYTKDDYYSFFVSDFSTTTEVDKTAYEITLLESYKKAFEYIGESGCGIPSITLTGTKADWQMILTKLEMLRKIGLSRWCNALKPVITEFVNVFDGNINKDFWQSIYKSYNEYGAYYLSGWVIKFFPYIKVWGNNGVYDTAQQSMKIDEAFVPNKFIDGNRYLISTLSTDNFPSGLSKIDVKWINEFKHFTKQMEVCAGFFAIKQYADKSLEPLISWTVCFKDTLHPSHIVPNSYYQKLKHKEEYWSPKIMTAVSDSAKYDIKKFKTQKAGLDFIRKLMLDSLAKDSRLKNIDPKNDTLEFVIYSNGTPGDVKIVGNDSLKLIEFVRVQLQKLPKEWFPAMVKPGDIYWSIPVEDKTIKVRANSLVKIRL